MSNNKIQTQIKVNSTALELSNPYTVDDSGNLVDAVGRVCGSADYESGVVSLRIPPAAPINPASGKPYFAIRDDAWNGEWVAGEEKPILNSAFGGDDE